MEQPVDILLLGQKLHVKTDRDEAHIRQVVDHVEGKLESIQEHTKGSSLLHVALLACLNIAEELFRQREVGEGVARNKIRELITIIDHQIDTSRQSA